MKKKYEIHMIERRNFNHSSHKDEKRIPKLIGKNCKHYNLVEVCDDWKIPKYRLDIFNDTSFFRLQSIIMHTEGIEFASFVEGQVCYIKSLSKKQKEIK